MSAAPLRLVADTRSLLTKVAPRWRQRLGGDEDGTRQFLRLVQEMLLWPFLYPGTDAGRPGMITLVSDWELHLQKVPAEASTPVTMREVELDLLKRIWRRLVGLPPRESRLPLLSTYVHFWNPMTSVRVTEPIHLPPLVANPFDLDGIEALKLLAGFDLYFALDIRARSSPRPLFTANQLLQRLSGPPTYSIHWEADADGAASQNPHAIAVGSEESRCFFSALPTLAELKLSELIGLDKEKRRAALDEKAGDLLQRFDKLRRESMGKIRRPVQRALEILSKGGSTLVDGKWPLDEAQAAFFLFGLALNRKTLECEHLYNFPVSQGAGCSIISYTTSRELRRPEYCLCENLAMAALHPIMLSSFFDARIEAEASAWYDWSHETVMPITRVVNQLETAAGSLAAVGGGGRVADAERALRTVMRSFGDFMGRATEGVRELHESRKPVGSQKVDLAVELALARDLRVGLLGPEQNWYAAACEQFAGVEPDTIASSPVRTIVRRWKTAAEADEKFSAMQDLVELYLTPLIEQQSSARVSVNLFRLALDNLIRNAIDSCDWPKLVKHDPLTFRFLRLFGTVENPNCLTVSISNPLNDERATYFKNVAEAPPCLYDTWWHAAGRRASARGARLILHALTRLRPEYPAEEAMRWLVVRCYDPFTVELTLPVE